MGHISVALQNPVRASELPELLSLHKTILEVMLTDISLPS
jgi:hypothetical protein